MLRSDDHVRGLANVVGGGEQGGRGEGGGERGIESSHRVEKEKREEGKKEGKGGIYPIRWEEADDLITQPSTLLSLTAALRK